MANLTLTGYADRKFQKKAPESPVYTAMLNPDNITRSLSISYETDKKGRRRSPKYHSIAGTPLSFDIIIDCTGVVDDKRVDLKKEIENLSNVVYNVKSKTHRPNFVRITWGNTLHFDGVLTEMKIDYTFFKPDGTALRAKVSLTFTSYVDPKTKKLAENLQSPDVTHQVLVRDGDSLPAIAYSIYQDPDYFIELAKVNRLDKFRQLTPGTMLTAPPLKSTGAQNG